MTCRCRVSGWQVSGECLGVDHLTIGFMYLEFSRTTCFVVVVVVVVPATDNILVAVVVVIVVAPRKITLKFSQNRVSNSVNIIFCFVVIVIVDADAVVVNVVHDFVAIQLLAIKFGQILVQNK